MGLTERGILREGGSSVLATLIFVHRQTWQCGKSVSMCHVFAYIKFQTCQTVHSTILHLLN